MTRLENKRFFFLEKLLCVRVWAF